MEVELLRFPHKRIRAQIIKQYIEGRYKKAVCFSCGNAAMALEDAGVKTLHIGEHGVLKPQKWFTQAEIHEMFPDYFDATSGHLPAELMNMLANAYKNYLRELPPEVYVPTGSGETLVCLKTAFPAVDFVAVYNLDKATEYGESCPLNALVKALAMDVIFEPYKDGLKWLDQERI